MFGFGKKTETTAVQLTAQAQAEEQRSLANPSGWLLDLFGAAPVLSGVSVTPQNAMKCTAVRAAVGAIAEAIGGLPLHIYERNGDSRERAKDHPAYSLLRDQANAWTPSSQFLEQITRDALLYGNGYAFINRVDGVPRELNRLAPEAVSVTLDSRTAEPLYSHTAGAVKQEIDRQDILHIQAPSVDGVSGASPVMQCREAIGLSMTIEAHAARLFGRGAKPSGALSFKNKLSPDSAKRMQASWQAAHGGANAGGTAILEEDANFIPLTLSSVESQTLELWERSTVEIARIFRVPPHMIFELGRATWGNASEMGASFLRFTLMRWIKAIEGEVRLKLIDVNERDRFYAEFLVDDLLRADIAARADSYSKLIAARVLNPNEARAMENRAPYDGGDVFQNPNTTAAGAKSNDEA